MINEGEGRVRVRQVEATLCFRCPPLRRAANSIVCFPPLFLVAALCVCVACLSHATVVVFLRMSEPKSAELLTLELDHRASPRPGRAVVSFVDAAALWPSAGRDTRRPLMEGVRYRTGCER